MGKAAKRFEEYSAEAQFGTGEFSWEECRVESPVELFPANLTPPPIKVHVTVPRETILPPVLRLLPRLEQVPATVEYGSPRLLLLESVVMAERAAIRLEEADNAELQPIVTRMNALVALLSKRWRRRERVIAPHDFKLELQ